MWLMSFAIAGANGFTIYSNSSIFLIFARGFSSPLHFVTVVLYGLAVYGPLLAAIIVQRVLYGRGALNMILSQLNFKIKFKWFLLAVAIAISINVPVVFAIFVSTGFLNIGWMVAPLYWLAIVLPYFIYQLLTSGLEEPGWRGFLLPYLLKKHSSDTVSGLVGLAWAAWHYPLLLTMYWGNDATSILATFGGFTLAIIGASFIYTWLYKKTKSLWLAIVFHAAMNTASLFMATTGEPLLSSLPALATWVIVFILGIIDKRSIKNVARP
jgi:membrane protease YdiL (CAAX protease family)